MAAIKSLKVRSVMSLSLPLSSRCLPLFLLTVTTLLTTSKASIVPKWAEDLFHSGGKQTAQFVNTFQISPGDVETTDLRTMKARPAHEERAEEKPDFCHSLDCPSFTVLKKTEDYEERAYAASGWVSTTLTGVDYDAASSKMFYKLFNYIQGENAKKEKIAMTAPVITSVVPGPGPACDNNFTMSFFMSPKVTDPPAPSDKDVFLSNLPKQKVFVRSFGGFANKDKWLSNAEALANALVKDSQSFNKNFFYSAGYDSPFKILNRHNEVWYMAQD